jgi:hypothetical protein
MEHAMKELLEHAIKVLMVFGSGYVVTVSIVLGGLLRAARRTSDDWDEHSSTTPMQ